MTVSSKRTWSTKLGLFMASAALIGYQSRAFAPSLKVYETPATRVTNNHKNTPQLVAVPPMPDMPKATLTLGHSMNSPLFHSAFKECEKNKYAAVVVDAVTGNTLYGYDENTPRSPASLTKLMTMFVTFEAIEQGRINMDDQLSIPTLHLRKDLRQIGAKPGDYLTVKQALEAITTWSAADATDVLAVNISGSVENFVDRMNENATSLGMTGTHFTNTSGAPDLDQVSTASDMAVLMRSLQTYFPEECAIFKTEDFAFKGRHYKSHAKLAGADMAKTGLTDASKYNIAASFPEPEGRLIVVVFGGATRLLRNKHAEELHREGQRLLRSAPTSQAPVNHTRFFTHLPEKQDAAQLITPAPMSAKPNTLELDPNVWRPLSHSASILSAPYSPPFSIK